MIFFRLCMLAVLLGAVYLFLAWSVRVVERWDTLTDAGRVRGLLAVVLAAALIAGVVFLMCVTKGLP